MTAEKPSVRIIRHTIADYGTVGVMSVFDSDNKAPLIECTTLEPGTRHPTGAKALVDGHYNLLVFNDGALNQKYAERFHEFHKGMLLLTNTAPREGIMIHCGYTQKDSRGCIMLGSRVDLFHGLEQSWDTYSEVYKTILSLFNGRTLIPINIITLLTQGDHIDNSD